MLALSGNRAARDQRRSRRCSSISTRASRRTPQWRSAGCTRWRSWRRSSACSRSRRRKRARARAARGASGARCGVTRRADRGRCGLTQIRARAAPPRRSRRTRSVPPPFRARQAARRFGETARADGWLTENGVVKRRLVDEHSTARETAMRMRGEARRQFTARCSRLRAKRFRARRAASRAASRRCTTRGTSMRTTTAHIFLPAALPASRPLNPVSPLPVTLPPPARSTPAHASEMCKCARWIDDDVTRASFL